MHALNPGAAILLALAFITFVATANRPPPLISFVKYQLCVSQLEMSFLLLEDSRFHLVIQYVP